MEQCNICGCDIEEVNTPSDYYLGVLVCKDCWLDNIRD